jgi:hypothetical protein
MKSIDLRTISDIQDPNVDLPYLDLLALLL